MRRSFAAGLAALTLLLLAGCGGSKASPSEVPEQPSEEPAPPEPTAEELAAREIETILSSLTLEEKVGQLFFVRCPGTTKMQPEAGSRRSNLYRPSPPIRTLPWPIPASPS